MEDKENESDKVIALRKITQLKEEITYLENKNQELKDQLDEADKTINDLNQKWKEQYSRNIDLKRELDEKIGYLNIAEQELNRIKQEPNQGQSFIQTQEENQWKEYYLKQIKENKRSLEEKVNMRKTEIEKEFREKFKNFLQSIKERWVVNQGEYFSKYNQDIEIEKQEKKKLKEDLNKKIQENYNLKVQIDKLKFQQGVEIDYQKNQNNKRENANNQKEQNIDQVLKDQIKKDQDQKDQLRKEQTLREQQQRIEDLKKQDQQKKDKELREKDEKKKTLLQMFQQIKKSHGIIEICFLVDITGSMETYKEQAKKCIKDSIEQIKQYTQKETRWSVVGYQDFRELKQLGGKYQELQFTQDLKTVERFLDALTCAGGGDTAEDIRGGIKQMVELEWTKQFKLAILICDAPTHGKRYNGGQNDNYPNEDIQDAIHLLIDNNIFLMAIQFNSQTQIMFQEIKKIYQAKNKTELLLIENAQNVSISQLSNLFTNLIANASLTLTQMNNSASKINNKKNLKKSEIVSVMQNLCKNTTDIVNFDKDSKIPTVTISFEVYRVELLNESLEKNIEDIKQLKLDTDFKTFEETGIWNCIRTVNPFAEGSVKQVYLMKKVDTPTELYVIKMPLGNQTYPSKQEAIKDCRSHLIAKCLLEKFIRDLKKANMDTNQSVNIIDIQYSNFLILKDSSSSNSFWVAERYFIGEFIKYNNNGSFILNDSSNEINHFAQAFSFYTYFKSNLNYMVCDVQGIGHYFTDPAINTQESKFDETDMGPEGIKDFIGTYQGRRNLGEKYLKLLDIYELTT